MQYQYLAVAAVAFISTSSATAPVPTSYSDDCVCKCNDAYDTCRTKPNASMASCAAEYSSCLGYVPFNSAGSLVTPTACSITTSAKSTSTPTADACACATACDSAYNTCRTKPNANMASCAAEYSSCLGYVPFNSAGSLVTPTACSITTSVKSTPTPTADACATACDNAYNTCRTKPNANMASCASEYSSCLGYVPFNNSGSLVTPTACSITISAIKTTATTSAAVTLSAVKATATTPASVTRSAVKATATTPASVTRSAIKATTTAPAVYTGAAHTVKPAMGLLALGALAML